MSTSPATQIQTPPADLAPQKLPRHIAIIMDGNGRWAQRQGLPRIEGHRHGAASVRRTVEACARLGIEQLTLYCLSSENWKRPQLELDFLMHLLEQYLIEERASVIEHNLRLAVIGRREGLPPDVVREMETTIALSSTNTGLRVCLAINYGGRAELVDAVRQIAEEAARGALRPDQVGEQTIDSHLYTAGMPELDLLIRTAGEMRVSNFLLWQMSYAELWVTERLWPDFDENELYAALRSFAGRRRRYGGLEEEERMKDEG